MATVLIVDDDKHTRALLERILHHDARIARHGVRVVSAGDGIEGLRLYDSEKPDVVITDLLMPRMDGFRFCKEVRSREGKPPSLLVLTGVYRDVAIGTRLRDEYGASLYTKPYQIKDLVQALDRQLARLGPEPTGEDPTVRVDVVDTPLPVAEERRGRLEEVPLGRVILDLYEERATGVLELRRGRIEKRIDLVIGHPVAVVSNQRAEMLGHFLVMKGVITEKVHQLALERAADEEKKLGEALAEMGVLSAADLVKQLTSQARFKITRSLRWPDGEWSFRPHRELPGAAAKGNALDPVAVVFLGLKKTASVEQAAVALAPLDGRRVKLTARGDKVRNTIVRAFGEPLAEALEMEEPLERLLAPPFEPSLALPALEALLITGCITDAGAAEREAHLQQAAEPPDVEELSGAFRLPPPPPPPPRPPSTAYDGLFADEISDVDLPAAAGEPAEVIEFEATSDGVPEEIPLLESSLVEIIETGAIGSSPALGVERAPEVAALREALLAEYLRLQAKDMYAVLQIERTADAARVEAAYAERMAAFSLEKHEEYDIGPDYGKLEEIHAAYRRAYETLHAPERRAAYDRELAARRPRMLTEGQIMAAELAFRAGERRMQAGNFASAVEHLRLAVDSAPDIADYHAAFGWALHRAGGPAASEASAQLGQALAIDPDHAAAHEYFGRLLAAEGKDDEAAAGHLERAIDAKPPRLGALEPLEALRTRRGEPRLLERLYRSLLRRAKPGDAELALRLWRGLGRAYVTLGDRAAARTAYQTAQRMAPEDPAVLEALAALASDLGEKSELLRARWRLDPLDPAPGRALFSGAREAGAPDAAFLAAAVLAARGMADDDADAMVRRYRPRFLVRAMRTLEPELWELVRHPEDDPEIGAVFAIIAAAGETHAPLAASDLEVAPDDIVAEPPDAFAHVRDYVAHMLRVPRVRVARRTDFAGEAHLGALPTPVLLVGPDVLASTNKVELAFRLGRAMSYLWPGRAFAGSRPARVLKELFIATVRMGGVPVALEASPSGTAAAARALDGLARADQDRAGRLAAAIASTRLSVNLSSWSRALARSADRVGLALCGDVGFAAQAVRVLGGDEAANDLLDYALSTAYQRVRRALGVSIDV